MGLIGTGIKAGAMYGIARQGIKAYESHNQAQAAQQQQYYAQQMPQQMQQQPQTRDVNGYAHQAWCNGQCGAQCNGSGYLHQTWCNGQCSSRCNGDQSHAIRAVDDHTRLIEDHNASSSASAFALPQHDQKPPVYQAGPSEKH